MYVEILQTKLYTTIYIKIQPIPQVFFVQLFTKQSDVTIGCHQIICATPESISCSPQDREAHHRPDTSRVCPSSCPPLGGSIGTSACPWWLFGQDLGLCQSALLLTEHLPCLCHKADTPVPPWIFYVPWAAPAWHCSSPGARWRHLMLKCPGNAATQSETCKQFFCGLSITEWSGLSGQPHPYSCCRPWMV